MMECIRVGQNSKMPIRRRSDAVIKLSQKFVSKDPILIALVERNFVQFGTSNKSHS